MAVAGQEAAGQEAAGQEAVAGQEAAGQEAAGHIASALRNSLGRSATVECPALLWTLRRPSNSVSFVLGPVPSQMGPTKRTCYTLQLRHFRQRNKSS